MSVVDTLADFAAQLPDVVIALDFDGPLAPIVTDPQQSRPLPGAIDTLARLAASGVQVAVVTGRDVETVLRLGQLANIPNVIVSGVHGAQTWQAGQLRTTAEPVGLTDLRAQLPPLLSEAGPGIWLEDKRLSLVVHTRQAADPVEALAQLRLPITELAEGVGLEVHPGKFVLEIRIPNLSKADAMEALLALRPSAALFAGDDLGDVPAFAAVRAWATRTGSPGLAIAVGEVSEVRAAANLHVDTARELLSLLSELAHTLDD